MGRFFSFGKKVDPSQPLEASPASVQASDAASAGHPLLDQARDSAKASLETTARRTRGSRADKASLQADSRALPADIQAAIQQQIEDALSPKPWAALLALPADTALALTGREYWKLSKDERDTLGMTGSAMARTMMIQNPKMLCAIMLGSALFSAYLPRAIEELHYQQEKRRKKKAEEAARAKT